MKMGCLELLQPLGMKAKKISKMLPQSIDAEELSATLILLVL